VTAIFATMQRDLSGATSTDPSTCHFPLSSLKGGLEKPLGVVPMYASLENKSNTTQSDSVSFVSVNSLTISSTISFSGVQRGKSLIIYTDLSATEANSRLE
jgi:hypothetical protein